MTRSLVLPALTLSLLVAGIGCDERRHATRRSRTRAVQPTALVPSPPAQARTPAAAATTSPNARPLVATAPAATPRESAPGVGGQSGAKSLSPPAAATAPVRPSPAGAESAAAPEMAVVILMLPGAGDPARPGAIASANSGAPLTYKLSLAPGAKSATIELEGRPPVIAPVQRVYPSPSVSPSSLALLRSVPAAPPTKAPARPGAGPAPGGPAYGAAPPRPRYLAPPATMPPGNSPSDDPTALGDARGPRISRRAIPTTTRPALLPPEVEYTSANGAPIIE